VLAYPGRLTNCMAVTATDDRDVLASFSNYGLETDVCAPGNEIWSTWTDGGYRFFSGTSMAAPHVSGIAALLMSYIPDLTHDEIRDILIATADDQSVAGWDNRYGHGRVNAHGALLASEVWSTILASDPPHGAIDARQPTDGDWGGAFGWQSVELTLDGDVTLLTPTDFAITQQGGPALTQSITDVAKVAPGTVQLSLQAIIPVSGWTTIRHHTTGLLRIGYLPGDVDGDATSSADDVLALRDIFRGVGNPLPPWSTDIDRSGLTAPADIVMEIDLLNGAGANDAYLNATLPKL